MKKSEFYQYIRVMLRHVEDINLAALYAESIINNYSDDFARAVSEEISKRPAGYETLVQVCADLYLQGIFEPLIPLELQVVKKLTERGPTEDVVRTLIEKNNLKNAIKVIAAGCEWLPEEVIQDDLIDKVAEHVSLLAE